MKNNWQLFLSLILATILLITMYGCGTRKVDLQVKDSIHIENTYSQGTKIVLGNTFTYKPFDALKPMVIEGKEYKNAIITNDKSIVKTKWKDRYITKTIVTEKTKQTEKTDYTIAIIGCFFVVCLFILAWLKLPSFKMVF